MFHFLKARERSVFRDWLQIRLVRRRRRVTRGDSGSTNTAAQALGASFCSSPCVPGSEGPVWFSQDWDRSIRFSSNASKALRCRHIHGWDLCLPRPTVNALNNNMPSTRKNLHFTHAFLSRFEVGRCSVPKSSSSTAVSPLAMFATAKYKQSPRLAIVFISQFEQSRGY